jgi:RNA polymerase sigma factor (sigma-70 family)
MRATARACLTLIKQGREAPLHSRRMTSPSAPAEPSTRQTDAAALLSRVALGDRAAFGVLYRTTSAHLLGVILRIQSHRGVAEEVLQEVYVNVWRSAGQFDAGRAQPLTWLTSIARHRAIDSLRRAQIEPDGPPASASLDDDGSAALEAHPSDAPGPLELLGRAAEAKALQDCVATLGPAQQQSLALAFYQGLSHAEVAEHLGQPLGTVKSWVRRALIALRECLERAARLA